MTSSHPTDLQGEVVVITGASRGLGRATAEAFGTRGARVVVNYRSNTEAAKEAVEVVEAAHDDAEAIAVQADVSDPEAIVELFERVDEAYGTVDVFVHNAAVTAFKPLTEVTAKDVSLTYDLCVTGFLLAAQHAIDRMDEDGRIIAVSANDSHTYMPLHGLLGSAKASLECLVRYLAVEQADNGIMVNAINPGILDKENYYASISEETKDAMDDLKRRTPKGDAVPPSAVAESIVTFAGPGTEWVTGEVLNVDGGFAAL
ncbi:SDR family NAD(P)-dependent oxidoreductase [Halorientalis marina]|jgi:NAD(P)-dependent dehydrogenase (short-subunit alcohol dehydrogenase family)|uniref:SDR family NAD(P)-dependent oxidoreductase n=1 Tax=Halorientalis marina TaxID=2931976 RepID=UPI001FF6CDF9|nr:SDR family oxidoreductase [Halorientalis marina]